MTAAWLHSATMDLHVIGPLASPAERAAVDSVLGPATSRWVGGARDVALDGHASQGGHAARARRDLLLPVLHAVQGRVGWISQPAINYVAKRLAVPPAEAYGVATFYALYATKPRPPVVAHVCDDIACRLAGAEDDLRRSHAGRRRGRRRRSTTAGPPGSARPAWACATSRRPRSSPSAGEQARNVTAAPVDAAGIAARLHASAMRRAAVARAAPATGPAASPPTARSESSIRPRSTTTASTVATRPAPRAGDRPGSGHRRGHDIGPGRARWRRIPDRAEVGRGRRPAGAVRTTSSATPTNRSRARSRTGCCSRATRTPSSRR